MTKKENFLNFVQTKKKIFIKLAKWKKIKLINMVAKLLLFKDWNNELYIINNKTYQDKDIKYDESISSPNATIEEVG